MGIVALGAGHIGGEVEDREVFRLLDRALELGIELFDTARSYGASEERIGRWLEGRRARVRISTKVGYGVEGHQDWTGSCITAGIERALRTLRTDRIELVHLHSCPIETLAKDEILEALAAAVRAGKVGTAAYSGDGEALDFALRTGAFGALQATLNVCDRANAPILLRARNADGGDGASLSTTAERSLAGLITIAKRPLANAPWRFSARPEAHDLSIYFDRWRALALEVDLDPMELCLRWVAHHPAISHVLIGTQQIVHLEAAVAAVGKGSLPRALVERIESSGDSSWPPIT